MTLEERILELEEKLKETRDPFERRKIINKIESLEEYGGLRVDDLPEDLESLWTTHHELTC